MKKLFSIIVLGSSILAFAKDYSCNGTKYDCGETAMNIKILEIAEIRDDSSLYSVVGNNGKKFSIRLSKDSNVKDAFDKTYFSTSNKSLNIRYMYWNGSCDLENGLGLFPGNMDISIKL